MKKMAWVHGSNSTPHERTMKSDNEALGFEYRVQ